ncbi:hypothetical protein NPIL_235521 [Nephila pilipes]|uniref:SH3 domain-containing protein n=1 Tax=Nephila pilipes TaxID=299642 RepID=A0A8X6P9C2_NEPPI|nr:hypothetical protein NPIL_235521 [Nephila pilipes]
MLFTVVSSTYSPDVLESIHTLFDPVSNSDNEDTDEDTWKTANEFLSDIFPNFSEDIPSTSGIATEEQGSFEELQEWAMQEKKDNKPLLSLYDILYQVVVVTPYTAETDLEFCLKKGDLIDVIDDGDVEQTGLLYGIFNDEFGAFPQNITIRLPKFKEKFD